MPQCTSILILDLFKVGFWFDSALGYIVYISSCHLHRICHACVRGVATKMLHECWPNQAKYVKMLRYNALWVLAAKRVAQTCPVP
jgi:hypothetical protein